MSFQHLSARMQKLFHSLQVRRSGRYLQNKSMNQRHTCNLAEYLRLRGIWMEDSIKFEVDLVEVFEQFYPVVLYQYLIIRLTDVVLMHSLDSS
jgi:hypothetical protein